MTKQVYRALERVFAAEIENRLPFQSRAKIFPELCEQGLLLPMEVVYGGRFPVIVKGFQLSELGRLMYCTECSETQGRDSR